MEVILQENYPSLGYVGERVKVKRGYARNFLVPRGIAVEASSGSARELKHRLEMINRKRQRLLAEAQKMAQELQGLILEFTLSSGQGGKSFGAVSIKDIENSLVTKGHKIERKQIRLLEPIKTSGEFSLEVKLHSELSAAITVRVAIEKPAPVKKAEEDDEDAGGRGGKGRRKPRREFDSEDW
jgi:large subunit ribosomal protein L9